MRATGAEGQKVNQHLIQKTRLTTYVFGVATLNMLAGLWLYYILSGLRLSFLRSGYGLVLTIGSLAGIVSWFVVVVVVRGIFSRMAAIGGAIQAQGGPPNAEQSGELQALGARVTSMGNYSLAFLAVAVAAMAAARYVQF